MSEWWTYSLSDLILFSRGAYFRLIELYNAAIWPAQIGAFALGVVILERSLRGGARAGRGRGIAALLAAAWLWVAIAFHAARYATLNTAAPVFAWIFAIEAALILWIGRRPRPPRLRTARNPRRSGAASSSSSSPSPASRSWRSSAGEGFERPRCSGSLPTRPPSERWGSF